MSTRVRGNCAPHALPHTEAGQTMVKWGWVSVLADLTQRHGTRPPASLLLDRGSQRQLLVRLGSLDCLAGRGQPRATGTGPRLHRHRLHFRHRPITTLANRTLCVTVCLPLRCVGPDRAVEGRSLVTCARAGEGPRTALVLLCGGCASPPRVVGQTLAEMMVGRTTTHALSALLLSAVHPVTLYTHPQPSTAPLHCSLLARCDLNNTPSTPCPLSAAT
jgi:hypothetical protein